MSKRSWAHSWRPGEASFTSTLTSHRHGTTTHNNSQRVQLVRHHGLFSLSFVFPACVHVWFLAAVSECSPLPLDRLLLEHTPHFSLLSFLLLSSSTHFFSTSSLHSASRFPATPFFVSRGQLDICSCSVLLHLRRFLVATQRGSGFDDAARHFNLLLPSHRCGPPKTEFLSTDLTRKVCLTCLSTPSNAVSVFRPP